MWPIGVRLSTPTKFFVCIIFLPPNKKIYELNLYINYKLNTATLYTRTVEQSYSRTVKHTHTHTPTHGIGPKQPKNSPGTKCMVNLFIGTKIYVIFISKNNQNSQNRRTVHKMYQQYIYQTRYNTIHSPVGSFVCGLLITIEKKRILVCVYMWSRGVCSCVCLCGYAALLIVLNFFFCMALPLREFELRVPHTRNRASRQQYMRATNKTHSFVSIYAFDTQFLRINLAVRHVAYEY